MWKVVFPRCDFGWVPPTMQIMSCLSLTMHWHGLILQLHARSHSRIVILCSCVCDCEESSALVGL